MTLEAGVDDVPTESGLMVKNTQFQDRLRAAQGQTDLVAAVKAYGALIGCSKHFISEVVRYDVRTGQPAEFAWAPDDPWEGDIPERSKLGQLLKQKMKLVEVAIIAGYALVYHPSSVEVSSEMGHSVTERMPAYFTIHIPTEIV